MLVMWRAPTSSHPISWQITATAAVVLGMLALLIFSLADNEPVYECRRMSEWGDQLKDASPIAQRRAAIALGRIGKKASRHAAAMTCLLDTTVCLNSDAEADLAISIVNGLYNMNNDFSSDTARAHHDQYLRAGIPALKRYKNTIYTSMQKYDGMLLESDSADLHTLSVRAARFRKVYTAIDKPISNIIWIRSSDPN